MSEYNIISPVVVAAILRAEEVVDKRDAYENSISSNDEYYSTIAIEAQKILDKENPDFGWVDCTEEEYWESDSDVVAFPCGGEVFFYNEKNCPYGWNVLCRSGAKIMHVKVPTKFSE